MKITVFVLGSLLFFHSGLLYSKIQTSEPPADAKVDYIHVEKQKRLMTVYYHNYSPKTYRIALGFSPLGNKMQEGDGKTPEGIYTITKKNPHSHFHRSLKLSYPSEQDWKRAKKQGVHPGSDIMIHGLSAPFHHVGKWHAMRDWTLGCVAVTNDEIEEIYQLADVGTKVKISP